MRIISAEEIERISNPKELVEQLRSGFISEVRVPARHHHTYAPKGSEIDSTLLLMPSWQTEHRLGVKVVTISPENGQLALPAIHGIYLLFETKTGRPLAQLDGTALTVKRTAAASALSSSFLSRPDSKTLLMVGTGALAPELIKGHCSVREIEQVLIWGRNPQKAEQLNSNLNIDSIKFEVVTELNDAISRADIISCATLSKEPLIQGEFCKPGQHIDLVGAYLPTMRESNSALIAKAEVFVDTPQGIMESGDIAIPIQEEIISKNDIKGDLYTMSKGEVSRTDAQGITVFKSVGHALEDLVAANYYYDNNGEE